MLQNFIDQQTQEGRLVVQPRMGFSDLDAMRQGLIAVKEVSAPTVGTITIDSFTRLGDFDSASDALKNNTALNGYPIVSYSTEQNQDLLNGVIDADFPVQVRHGSSLPFEIFQSTIDAGIDATEGGPISYCLPYSRVPLIKSVAAWRQCSQLFAEAGSGQNHLESFGGCMMGQLCPPSLLIAITVLEAMFFVEHGNKSISLSLAQGTNSSQDLAALQVLEELSNKYLASEIKWHIVYYTFMGKFPQTYQGAYDIIEASALLAKMGNARRLIVKTVKEAHQIPAIQDNLDALNWTSATNIKDGVKLINSSENQRWRYQIHLEATALIDAVLNLSNDLDTAIAEAFQKGYLDVPFCLHDSNRGESLARIDQLGNIQWLNTGKMPIGQLVKKESNTQKSLSSQELLQMLSYNQYKYDYKDSPNKVLINE